MRVALATVAVLLAFHALNAAEQGGFLACGAIESPEERLACFDAAYERAAGSMPVSQPEEPVQVLVSDKPPVEPAVAEPPAPPPSAPVPEASAPAPAATAAGTAAVSPQDSPAQVPTAAGAESAAPAPETRTARSEAEFGLRERPEPREPESLRSAITRVNRDPYDRLIFYLENGQVWQQTETRRFRVPEDKPVAIIRPGSLGSYKLYLENESRWTRVRRIQ